MVGGGAAARFPLHLVSSQPQHKLHSQMDAGAGQCWRVLNSAGKIVGTGLGGA
jgi:hypothetical protein